MSALDLPVTKLTGIGKVKAEAFGKLSIRTVGDLLLHFPSRYENRGLITPLRDGSLTMAQSYVLTVATPPRSARIGGRMTITKFRAFDDSGTIEVTYFNQPYVADRIHVGETFRFYGRLTEKKGKYSLPSPTAEPVLPDRPLPALYAVYPLAAGLNNNTMRACVAQALDLAHAELGEILPEDIRRAYSLATYAYAIENIHRPPDTAALDRAARRLAFDEMLESALAARLMRAKQTRVTAQRMADTDVSPLTAALPFALTGAQKRTVDEICADLARGKSADAPRMARIIVGDVGSGKTACALAATSFSQVSSLFPTVSGVSDRGAEGFFAAVFLGVSPSIRHSPNPCIFSGGHVSPEERRSAERSTVRFFIGQRFTVSDAWKTRAKG